MWLQCSISCSSLEACYQPVEDPFISGHVLPSAWMEKCMASKSTQLRFNNILHSSLQYNIHETMIYCQAQIYNSCHNYNFVLYLVDLVMIVYCFHCCVLCNDDVSIAIIIV